MFEVKVEGLDRVLKKFDTLSEQITGLHQGVPDELTAWQRDDMHRKYPNTTVQTQGNETAATTEIWPRSRQPSKDQHHQRQQGPKQYRPAKRGPVVRSNRPILRAELLQQLWDRMVRLASGAIKWP
jgi:hypothetical protein